MRSRVLGFLQTRPWLFGVDPQGALTITRLAREGLIYKRDVITYLYHAFVDNAPHVTLMEIQDRVLQPPGMQQVMMVRTAVSCFCMLSTPFVCSSSMPKSMPIHKVWAVWMKQEQVFCIVAALHMSNPLTSCEVVIVSMHHLVHAATVTGHTAYQYVW